MASEIKSRNEHDEAYQYPNEEYVSDKPQQVDEPAHKTHFIWRLIQSNRRITIVCGLIIAAIIAFKILGYRHRMAAVAPVAAPPVVQQSVNNQPNPEVLNQLDRLKRADSERSAILADVQNEMSSLRDELNQTHQQQAQFNQTMAGLVEQIKQLSDKLEASQKPTPKKKIVAQHPVIFHIKAIIPGRAWIVSNEGLSITVREGDTIPQYGKVQSVDADRGEVLTSSGKTIIYGSNDR